MKQITLKDIMELKGGSIEGWVMLAKSSGLTIPNDPDYVLTNSEIKAISPNLAFELKYSKTPKKENPRIRIDKKKEKSNSTIPKQVSNRIIGVVKFFREEKNYGFISSNNQGFPTENEEYSIKSLHFKKSEKYNDPKEQDWVIFTPKQNDMGLQAKNVSKLDYNKESLLLAMQYRGKFAKIKGRDGHSRDVLNYNILNNIVGNIIVDESKYDDVVGSFCEYISLIKLPENQQETINEFLLDEELKTTLISVFLSKQYDFGDSKLNSIFQAWEQALIDAIFKTTSQDIYLPMDKITDILINEAKDKTDAVKGWLKRQTNIVEALNLDNKDTKTISLRKILFEITDDANWISPLDVEWDEINVIINQFDEPLKTRFIREYLVNKDYDFVNEKLGNCLSTKDFEKLASELLEENNSDYSNILKVCVEHLADRNLQIVQKFLTAGNDINYILPKVQTLLGKQIKKDLHKVSFFLEICSLQKIKIESLFPVDCNISDELRAYLFVETNDFEYLNAMDDFDSCNKWIAIQEPKFVMNFIKQYGPLIEDEKEDDTFIASLGKETVANALKTIQIDEQYQTLRFFPKAFANEVVFEHFASSKLFDMYAGERWEELKAQIPYLVFDLESNGDSIKEFAFYTDGYTHYYEDEGQIDTLINNINSGKIVVGHRIKQWDLPILKRYGHTQPAFVWDTLEIEILLNPCRYAYSLHTSHNAKDDTELTNKLFWNQLLRLAQKEDLCKQLADFLPANIVSILQQLQNPIFKDFFNKSMEDDNSFFQNLKNIDQSIIEQLDAIDKEDNVLIIAPKRIWNRIAEHIEVSFEQSDDNNLNYKTISEVLLQFNPLPDKYLQTLLLRFVQLAKTPIVSNLAQYIRINYLKDELLLPYIREDKKRIICTDLNSIPDLNGFSKVYFIGCELENRMNEYSLPTLLRPSDFLEIKSSIPMRIGASSFMVLNEEDRELELFSDLKKKEDVANVWLERTQEGRYKVNYNYNIYQKLKKQIESNKEKFSAIPWFSNTQENKSITLLYSKKNKKVDKRVSPTSRYRSVYWMHQMAILSDIRVNMPIVYILENNLEISDLIKYAESLGYYVPTEGSLVSKLEKIAHNPNGLLIVSKDKFFDIVDLRLDYPYCYVWDQMAVEKHLIMWRGLGKDISKELLSDGIETAKVDMNIGSTQDTYQSTLTSLWPVYCFYNKFILANNGLSEMYIIDPFLDEYHSLSSVWNCNSQSTSSALWNNDEKYNADLQIAKSFFKDFENSDIINNEESKAKAMEVILQTLITQTDEKGKKKWKPIQEEILPEILSKQENYLVSLPTGGGKSVLFQGPALYNSSFTNRLSIVVTPLKALMQDQVNELQEKGFYTNVDFLNGDKSYQEVRAIYRKINSGEIALLYVTPERFRSKAFIDALMTRLANDDGLEYIIFDEAHCISQWGMEFRPEYLNVIKRCKELTQAYTHKVCIAMFSATVTEMIYNHINELVAVKRLGQGLNKKSYNPIRDHIKTEFKEVEHPFENRVEAIVEYIRENKIDFKNSRMLIFCKRKKDCEELAVELPELLNNAKLLNNTNVLDKETAENCVGYFHAGLDSDERDEAYQRFKLDDKELSKSGLSPIYILCATKAFGMGMDIPNIHYIVHLSPPNVLEDYLQEVGRAGRDKAKYEIAGFSESNPIPTLCLFSKEDIKKSREQLLSSMLSWKNLEEIRTSIIGYAKKIQPLETSKTIPVVVPNNLWKSNAQDYDYTDFRLGEYWLERMGRMKMGYLSPAHINITVYKDINIDNFDSKVRNLYKRLLSIAEEKDSETIQVSVQELAGELSMLPHQMIDSLIVCQKNKMLSIRQTMRCRITNTRIQEVPYMLKNPNVELTFHIILNATEQLLSNTPLNKEKSYTDDEIKNLLQTNSLDPILKKITKTDKKGNQTTKEYMPWYEDGSKNKKQGLCVARNYKNDLIRKRLRHIFISLLDIIPDVKCKSYIDRDQKKVKQSLIVEKNTWRDYLPSLKSDCLKVLKYISNHTINETLDWATAINNLNLEIPGFKHFENILRCLSCLAYISTDNILPTGIEVYATNQTEDVILEQLPENSADTTHKNEFDEAMRIRNLRLCIMDVLTNKVKNNKQEFQQLVSAYFSKVDANGFIELLEKYCPNDDRIWESIRETEILKEEEKMRKNHEQWAIYSENSNNDVNVEAGPGSGKTHVLTMRCAKLIYRQHVQPSQILVLAYNRAVVVELKERLNKLFTSLGLSRSASQLHIHTFHALAKVICGEKALEGREMKEWEKILLDTIQNNPQEVKKALPDLRYILIDEFQDITQVRLDSMFGLRKIYGQLSFFSIGDKDQSIYGFEKEESVDPNYYYDQLYKEIGSKRMTMSTNYRSYPKILEEASKFLPETSKIPNPCKAKIDEEPNTPYTFIHNNSRVWSDDFPKLIEELKDKGMSDVAVFFRTNSEVYYGYSVIKTMNIPEIRLRIQGASECELYRKREIYSVINYLVQNGNKTIELQNNKTMMEIKEKVSKWINSLSNWDSFYLDFAFTLVLDFLKQAESEDELLTFGDMAQSIKETLTEENPQLYKLYDKYQDQRIIKDKQLNVILTTMHKVKGLEFDAIVVTPSVASLPFDPTAEVDIDSPIRKDDKEKIEEEKRLLYVAYTRAKKYLASYLGKRENCIINTQKYAGDDNSLGIKEKEATLKNYNIGYNASEYNFTRRKINDLIVYKLGKNQPASIIKSENKGYVFYNIVCNNQIVGQLSRNSSIRRTMEANQVSALNGFFVSDIFFWTYQDTLLADERNDTNWADNWCDEAKKQGYIFVVSISGYGK